MSFTVILPARLSSSRLPEKALADIGGKPMIVRAAEQAEQSHAHRVLVATDHERIQAACAAHGVEALMTGTHHSSGTTRLAEVVQILQLPDDEMIVNVQGDEPLMPPVLIDRVASKLAQSDAVMATAAHFIDCFDDFVNPNCVKVVVNRQGYALYFSRAPIAYPRDAMLAGQALLPEHCPPLRHIGIYAYRVGFLKRYAQLAESPLEQTESLEQLRVLWHGDAIAVETVETAPPTGVDTLEDLMRVRQLFESSEKAV